MKNKSKNADTATAIKKLHRYGSDSIMRVD